MKIASGKYSPFELNSILLDPRTAFKSLVPDNFQKKSLFWCYIEPLKLVVINIILALIRIKLKDIFAGPKKYRYLYDKKIIFFLLSHNNLQCLSRVIDIVSSNNNNVTVIESGLHYRNCPYLRILLFSFLCVPLFWKGIHRYSPSDRRVILYHLREYVFAYGVVWFYKKILKTYRPEIVIMANDHYYQTKGLELVCEEYDIKTIYVQHASVSYAFPELHFTYSFLDGKDAWLKYVDGEKRAHGDVFLLGAIRFDALSLYRISRTKDKRHCIGIAVNMLDDNAIVNDVCNSLLGLFPDSTIKVRFHPRMEKNSFVFDNRDRIFLTSATDEAIGEYIDSIDLQVAGDSSVHFDAIIGGITSIAFNFTKFPYADNYGYVEIGLVRLATLENLSRICNRFEKENTDKSLIRRYDESYEKHYAGHCSEIVAQFILANCRWEILNKDYNLQTYTTDKGQYFKIP